MNNLPFLLWVLTYIDQIHILCGVSYNTFGNGLRHTSTTAHMYHLCGNRHETRARASEILGFLHRSNFRPQISNLGVIHLYLEIIHRQFGPPKISGNLWYGF